jgi:hypothetical protein
MKYKSCLNFFETAFFMAYHCEQTENLQRGFEVTKLSFIINYNHSLYHSAGIQTMI